MPHGVAMKTRGQTQRRADARAPTVAGAPPSDEIASTMVRAAWVAALFPLGRGCLMYFVDDSDFEKSKLINPVATVGEFVQAQCKTHSRATPFRRSDYMRVTYQHNAPYPRPYDEAGAPINISAQPLWMFTATKERGYRSWVECEAAQSALRLARPSHPVWYQPTNPALASTSFDAPAIAVFLWVGMASIPLALYAWLLGDLRQRQLASNQAPQAAPAPENDRLRYPLQFVKFTQKPVFTKMFICLVFLLLIGGFAAQFFWASDKQRAGEERLRAAVAQERN